MSDKKNDALNGISTAMMMLANQQQQLLDLLTLQQLKQKQDDAEDKIDFSQITPTETLTEMLIRCVFQMGWEELTRYGESEDYAYELVKSWILDKPRDDRPIRYNQDKYFLFENLKGVRGWTSYGSAKVVTKIFEKMVHLCWERLEQLAKTQKPHKTFRIDDQDEEGDVVLSKMVILNSIVSKDETAMFQQRTKMVKKLAKHIAKN